MTVFNLQFTALHSTDRAGPYKAGEEQAGYPCLPTLIKILNNPISYVIQKLRITEFCFHFRNQRKNTYRSPKKQQRDKNFVENCEI
jgi:hypothetical protein